MPKKESKKQVGPTTFYALIKIASNATGPINIWIENINDAQTLYAYLQENLKSAEIELYTETILD